MTTKQAAAIQSFMTMIIAGLALVLTLSAIAHDHNVERQARADKINAQDKADAHKVTVENARKFNARILKIKKSHNLVDCGGKAFLTDKIIIWDEMSDKMWVSTMTDALGKNETTWILRYCH